jgi:predicted nucleotidyltransferase
MIEGANLMDKCVEETLRSFLKRVLGKYDPLRIVLFGSHATGHGRPDSDLDLMIVMSVEGSTREKANEIDMLMSDRIVPMDLVVITPEQYERQRKVVGTIVYRAEREGQILYERAA